MAGALLIDVSSGLAGLVAVSRDRARAAPRSRSTWARVDVERSADRQPPVRDGSARAVGRLPVSHSDDDPAAPRVDAPTDAIERKNQNEPTLR
jgi:hypothetical protein